MMARQSWAEDQLRKYDFPVEPILRLSFTDSKVDELISNGVNFIAVLDHGFVVYSLGSA